MKNHSAPIIALLLISILITGCATASYEQKIRSTYETEALEQLGKSLESYSENMMEKGSDTSVTYYQDLVWPSVSDTFPSRFDLRDRGTVTSVKNQNPLGTCWAFSILAASETSILNSLGMTVERFKEEYGGDMDLSELHLSWFATITLPESSDYQDGEYPYDESQAGEGFRYLSENSNYLMLGGNFNLAIDALAIQCGPVYEEFGPYTNREGTLDLNGDWSLPEEKRFNFNYVLSDANILPAPSFKVGKLASVYCPEGTEAIKLELLKGRAVAVAYYSDYSIPEMDKEETKDYVLNSIKDIPDITDEERLRYAEIRSGIIDASDVSSEEFADMIRFRLKINNMSEDFYDLSVLDHDQLEKLLKSKVFGMDYETVVKFENMPSYMTFVGKDPTKYAQYTFEDQDPTHALTIVGWDDSFPAENWPEDRRPPADGVWFAKNSWGTDWGAEGYLLLSYYDKSMCDVVSVGFDVSKEKEELESEIIYAYDLMLSSYFPSSTLFDKPVYTANVFSVEVETVLQEVSVLTGNLDTTVTAYVYLMDRNATDPTQGKLLGSTSRSFKYGGFHRFRLDESILLPEGSRIGIVIIESVPTSDGIKYALVNKNGINEEGARKFNEQNQNPDKMVKRYLKGIVNKGESFVSFESGRWIDWTEVLDHVSGIGANKYASYDNHPIRAFGYPWSSVQEVHDLSNRIPVSGGYVAICPDDGYTVMEIGR